MNTIAPPIALAKLAHKALQRGKMALSLAHKTALQRILSAIRPSGRPAPTIDPQVIETLQQRIEALVNQDWQDGEAGVYPVQLLFDDPWLEYLLAYPLLCIDSFMVWNRSQTGKVYDFNQSVNIKDYPGYYARNFHNQTDGYLSDDSARLYDLQVEILFSGVADAMRRRVIAPLKARLRGAGRSPKILDIACGTGRTLRNLQAAIPDASLYGIDLSPHYLRRANETLRTLPETLPQLVQGNAESLPYTDGYFQGITNVFLFHELPGRIRQRIINESYRVLAPGGICVICDSIQQDDIPIVTPMLQYFPESFHEPFYLDYQKDNMDGRMADAGFEIMDQQTHFLSKYWVLKKPE
ncbi:MAG: class I SAM-dependent methyltransferase [Cyanophyceae cyanobacterium]